MSIETEDIGKAVHLLAAINRFNLKSFNAKTKQALIFVILNDTIQLLQYDRTSLWGFVDSTLPNLLGVSGQTKVSSKSPFVDEWLKAISAIHDLKQAQVIKTLLPLKGERELAVSSTLWLPIFFQDKLVLGLFLERWRGSWQEDEIEILSFLSKGYGAAWGKFAAKFSWKSLTKRWVGITAFLLIVALLSLRIPLRIAVPCELIPKDPIVVAAPLEGTIEEVKVTPGEEIDKGKELFQYDARVPLEELKVAEKQVEMARSELDRAENLSFKDPHALADLSLLTLKLKKEELQLDLARYRTGLLSVISPNKGVVMIDDPSEWRGRPVKVGEKVLMLVNPNKTKIRLWIPESDNIPLDFKKPIKIILNVAPTQSYKATLNYISSYSSLSDKSVPSFSAEADWHDNSSLRDIKMGLKGTAILYGDNVSLFYWIFRRPITSLRTFLGF